jgi:4'-phosphopantetheinyl transferase
MLWVRKEALVKVGSTTLDELSTVDLSALPMGLPGAGRPRRNRWGAASLVDLAYADPPAIAAVVSRSPIDVVPLDRLVSSPFVEELLQRLSGGRRAGRPGGHRAD